MSAYGFCDHCRGPLKPPTITDAALGAQQCSHCGHMEARTLLGFERRILLEGAEGALHSMALAIKALATPRFNAAFHNERIEEEMTKIATMFKSDES